MSQVLDRPSPSPSAPPRRPVWVLVVVVVGALVAGLAVGWLARGGGGGGGDPSIVAAGGSEATGRQEAMLSLVGAFTTAWNDQDSAAMLALFAPGGSVTLVNDGREYFVLDGTLADFLDRGLNTTPVELGSPALTGDLFAAASGESAGKEQMVVFEFTKGTGAPKLVTVSIVADY